MTEAQFFKNLTVPEGKVDIVLDTDTYNEIDDQYAIAYMVKRTEKFNVKGIYAAPFYNGNSISPEDGMEKSYDEILKVLDLLERPDLKEVVFKGSRGYLTNEKEPLATPAAEHLAALADNYSPEHPLYVALIGAFTNVASAILLNPNMKENCVFLVLGGHADYLPTPVYEFNMSQDIAAARVIFNSKVPIIQFPAIGAVDALSTSQYELEHWLKGKNKLCDYLYENTVREAVKHVPENFPWTRVIWDIIVISWFFNENEKLMETTIKHAIVPQRDYYYSTDMRRHYQRTVYRVFRDRVFAHLFETITNG
ncbi:MAG: nucleoside hydrolase [Ruminococcaceae bacterium]|nr:nucleoside hydrolase [Oscillospiraceae bacterium]